jgi:beta-lactam-binding protein with PASTA domain
MTSKQVKGSRKAAAGPAGETTTFKIDASLCNLRVGDTVEPETVIGMDFETGQKVKAGRHGRVEAVSFSGGEHALTIVIQGSQQATPGPAGEATTFKIDASLCNLRVGDTVEPETVIGMDSETGEMVKAGRHGRVEAVGFSGGGHALTIVIR